MVFTKTLYLYVCIKSFNILRCKSPFVILKSERILNLLSKAVLLCGIGPTIAKIYEIVCLAKNFHCIYLFSGGSEG